MTETQKQYIKDKTIKFIGNMYNKGQQNQSIINQNPLSSMQFSNGRSNQSKYGYSFQKGGSKQNPPKVYTDKKKFEQAQRMYNDSLKYHNWSNEQIKIWKKTGNDDMRIPIDLNTLKFSNSPINTIQKNKDRNYRDFIPSFVPNGYYQVTQSGSSNTSNVPSWKKPVQPVVYQPQRTVNTTNNTPQTFKQINKNTLQIIPNTPQLPKNTHPTTRMQTLHPVNIRVDNPQVVMKGQPLQVQPIALPQQKGTPIYGPGSTIIGYSGQDMQFSPAYQYTGASNNIHNLQDKELLNNPELLRKYVQSKDTYKFESGGKINDNNGYLTSNLHNFTPKKIINSNHITSENLAFPIVANNVPIYPNTGDYIFNTNKIIETPMLTRNYRPTFQMGGPQETPMMEQQEQGQEQQIMQMVAQALQQGTPPEQVMQMLVQQGIPPEQAQQIIQEVMSQMQGQMSQQQPTNDMQQAQPMVKHGGMLQFLQKGGTKSSRGMVDMSTGWKDFNIDPYKDQINSNITPEMFKQYEDYNRGYYRDGMIPGTSRANAVMVGGLDDNYYKNVANITGTDMTRLPGLHSGQKAQYAYGDQAFADAYNQYADQRNAQFSNNALNQGQQEIGKLNNSRYRNPLKRAAHSIFHGKKYRNEISGITDNANNYLKQAENYASGNYKFQKGGRTVSDVSSDYDGFYQQKYSNPRYMQSVVDAENSQVPIQSNNGLVGPPEYVVPQTQLNYNRPQEFTREQVFGNLNFGSQSKVMKSVQRVKVPTFSSNTNFGTAFNKARSQGADTFLHNGKLYTTKMATEVSKPIIATIPKTYKDGDLKEGVIKAKRQLYPTASISASPFAFKTNTISKDKVEKSDPQGYISKGWEILNNPVEAFGYGARNQRIPDHFSSGPKGRNLYDMALEIPKLGVPLGMLMGKLGMLGSKIYPYGEALTNANKVKKLASGMKALPQAQKVLKAGYKALR